MRAAILAPDREEQRWAKKDAKTQARLKRIHKALFNRPFPRKWHIYTHYDGACDYISESIYLAHGLDTAYDVETAVHELLHLVTKGKLEHGPLFDMVVAALTKLARKVK